MIHKKIQNDKRMRTRLLINGYKHFSKVSACGEDTKVTLENIVKSQNIRYIRRFEFDPYMCEKSYMKPLSKAMRKLKDIQEFNLVIRRLDYQNESNILEPFVMRLTRLLKIRLEMTKVENFDDNGLIRLAWMTGKLFSVREFAHVQVGMDHLSQYAGMHFKKYGRKLKYCTKYRKTFQKSSFITRNEELDSEKTQKLIQSIKDCRCLKEMTFSLSMPQGWLSMSTDVDNSAVVNLKTIASQKHLEKLHLHFCGNPVVLETIQGFSDYLPGIRNLRNFGLSLLK